MLSTTPNSGRGKTKLAPKFDKKWQLGAILVAIALIIGLAVIFSGADKSTKTVQNCGNYRNDKNVTINGSTFKAEAPNNQAAFDKGLGGRPCILPDEAMIFPFNSPGQYPFWMKGMKFPIDMIWINQNHQVVQDFMNVHPASYPKGQYANPKQLPALYVLEIKANRSKEIGIKFGTIVQF